MSIEVSQLANGIIVVTNNMKNMESVALGIWIKAGSRHEGVDQHGVAHLLEHMAFKGTENRSAFKIATDIEDVGGEINAATSVENTAYFARVLKEDMPLAVDILADILVASQFDEEELEREKHVVLQEIGAAHDTPDDIIFDHFSARAFYQQALGRPILGTPETVRGFQAKDLRRFMGEQYSGDRMVIVAAGAVEHQHFRHEIESRLGKFQADASASEAEQGRYIGGDFRESRELLDAQIVLGFEGRAFHMPDFYATQLLAMVLGGGMSSRLFQEIREKRGLCYSIYASHWGFSDTGLFAIHAATGREGLESLLPVIIDELHKACETITEVEVDRARAQYRSSLMMAQENPVSRAHMIARQVLLYGRPIPTSESMERLALITPAHLHDLATRLFFESAPTLAALGPIDSLMDYGHLKGLLSH